VENKTSRSSYSSGYMLQRFIQKLRKSVSLSLQKCEMTSKTLTIFKIDLNVSRGNLKMLLWKPVLYTLYNFWSKQTSSVPKENSISSQL